MKRTVALVFILLLACDYYKVGEEKMQFKLFLDHSITRVVDSEYIFLTWTEHYLEFYNKTLVQRLTENVDTVWQTITEFKDVQRYSYIDTIYDDENLNYRIGLVDIDNNILWAKSSINIPKTTSLFIPAEVNDSLIQTAFNKPIIDNYDTLYISPGAYYETLDLINKYVILLTAGGVSSVTIDARKLGGRPVTINSGEIHGFNITNGLTGNGDSGGGIKMSGNAGIYNCRIYDNVSSGAGGGIYLSGGGKIYNSIIYNNRSPFGGGGIFAASSQGRIVNNTIVNNNVAISISTDSLLFVNNIIVFPDTVIYLDSTSQATIQYNLYNNSRYNVGSNYIIGYPEFIDKNANDYRLQNTSPGINAGHPEAKYNNADGSRNTMGAYGGPFGANWPDRQ